MSKQNNLVKITFFIIITLLFSLTTFATPINQTEFTVGDNICQFEIGETKENSPQDCRYSLKDYASCLIDKENCFSENMFKQANITLCLFTILALALYFSKEKRLEEVIKKIKGN